MKYNLQLKNESEENKIHVLFEPSIDNPFAIIYKPSELPCAPLKRGDDSALTQCLKLFPSLNNVKGKKEIEAGLLHRIDSVTSGLVLIASTQSAYDFLCKEQNENRFIKKYRATVCKSEIDLRDKGFPPFNKQNELQSAVSENKKYTVESAFRYYGEKSSAVRPVTDLSGRSAKKKVEKNIYTTQINLTHLESKFYKAECTISKGFKHQVRCHLSWSGFPIVNDSLYCFETLQNKTFDFCACSLEFNHPLTKKKMLFELV